MGDIGSAVSSILNLPLGIANFAMQARQQGLDQDQREFENQFALEERDYARQMDQLRMDREDTAISRMASDASSVGINPLSLNGNGAQSSSGTVVSSPSSQPISAPQFDLGFLNNMSSAIEQSLNGQAQRDLLNAQKDLYNKQADFQQLQNDSFAVSHDLEDEKLRAEIEDLTEQTTDRKNRNADWTEDNKQGFRSTFTPEERLLTRLLNDVEADKTGFGTLTKDDLRRMIYRAHMDSGLKYNGLDLGELSEKLGDIVQTIRDPKSVDNPMSNMIINIADKWNNSRVGKWFNRTFRK